MKETKRIKSSEEIAEEQAYKVIGLHSLLNITLNGYLKSPNTQSLRLVEKYDKNFIRSVAVTDMFCLAREALDRRIDKITQSDPDHGSNLRSEINEAKAYIRKNEDKTY